MRTRRSFWKLIDPPVKSATAFPAMHPLGRNWAAKGFRQISIFAAGLLFWFSIPLSAQDPGRIQGVVLLPNGSPVHEALVLIVETGQETESDETGRFAFTSVEPGRYDMVAYSSAFTSQAQHVDVNPGQTVTIDFVLQLSPIQESITVTASGRHETTFEAVQSVNSLDSFDLAESMAPTIGEVLENEAGIAKRSFGPGSSRPVVRGFDGDRVLVMKDGVSVGSIGSQSGDHAEPIDPAGLERLEVVKGPATLLYGSSAIGGVVNAISRHHEMHKHRHEGARGHVSGVGGTNNEHLGGGASVEYGEGRWMFWAGGGGQSTGDYSTPAEVVENSGSRISNISGGFGFFPGSGYLTLGYTLNDGRYGVPYAGEFHGHGEEEDEEEEEGEVDLDYRHHSLRFDGGVEELGTFVESFRGVLSYTDWHHEEIEVSPAGGETVGTAFDNRQFIFRGVFEQREAGKLKGSFGFWGLNRDYRAVGEEALSPPVDQNSFALFCLEELGLKAVRLQFGARFEMTEYEPTAGVERSEDHDHQLLRAVSQGDLVFLPPRDFKGFSAGLGGRVSLWRKGALVANFTSGYRSPGLEELYNYGPHVGNLAFEIGDPNLSGERSNGLDLSLRHLSENLRAEANFFYYLMSDFIFLAPTGDVVDGLIEAKYQQADSRFHGAEFGLDFPLVNALWLNLGMDLVNAELKESGVPLPRIPPVRGRIGLDLRLGGLSIRPELTMAAAQDQVFLTEAPTPGYAVGNLKASYTFSRLHVAHQFSFSLLNIGNALYRNHLSFIKEFAPEIGRGIRFSYALRFF
ncbi:MAG: TonB-dependent receptor [Acidobacteriota bacterium]|nr:MAG: TonB-dependent receptor [Acidobacteriota bacterium]